MLRVHMVREALGESNRTYLVALYLFRSLALRHARRLDKAEELRRMQEGDIPEKRHSYSVYSRPIDWIIR